MKELQLISNHQAPEKPKNKGFFEDKVFWLGFVLGMLIMLCIDAQLWGLW